MISTTALPPSADSLTAVLRRFPLVARPRLACPPIHLRLAEITELIRDATEGAPDADILTAVAHNKAALIASDCGLDELARSLCWRHHNLYRHLRPWTERRTRLAVEPLINLARLHIRTGRPDAATQLLERLWHAVSTGQDTLMEGHHVSLHGFAPTSPDHRAVLGWLWTVIVPEGLRALVAAGRWSEALTHAQRYRGIGCRLLDGRQIAVLAHVVAGEYRTADRLIEESDPRQPWEHVVLACLRVLARPPASPPDSRSDVAEMIDRYLALDLDTRHSVFGIRLGLTVADLAPDADPRHERIVVRVSQHALARVDAYAAREVLSHRIGELLAPTERAHLLTLGNTAALGAADPGLASLLLGALTLVNPGEVVRPTGQGGAM